MKKLLFIGLILLCVSSAIADTTLVRPMQSVVGNSTNFNPYQKIKTWMIDGTSSYIYLVVRLGGSDGTAQKLSVLRSADGGATWSVDSTFLSGGTSIGRINAYGRKDTLYVMHNHSTSKYGRIARHRAGTAFDAAADTMQLKAWDTLTSGAFGGGGMVWVGDTLLYAQTHTTGTSVVLGRTVSAFGASPTWVQVDSATHGTALDAWYIPVEDLHGILVVGTGGAAMFGDIVSGWDTLATTTISPGGITAAYRTAFAVDSSSTNGTLPDTAIIHKATQTGEWVVYERYQLINTSDGTDSWTRTDVDTLATETEMPTPTTTGTEAQISFAYPFVQTIRGTDKVLFGYVFWDDVAQTDSTKLVYHLSNDNGQNWGARTTFRMKGDINYRMMISAPTIDEAGGVVSNQVSWADSISSAAHKDTIRVFNWTIGSVNDPVHTLTQVKVGHNRVQLKDSVIPVNGTVDSLKLFIKTTNPPTDVWRALDTSAATRVVKTYALDSSALTWNTKFYYRWAIKDDVGWDTSAVDSFTTKDSLNPVGKSLTTFLGATTAHIQCSVLTATVEPYNGTMVRAVFQWDVDAPPSPFAFADTILLATYPKDTVVLSSLGWLDVNTKHYFRVIVTDSGMTDTSAVDSFTTGTGVSAAHTVVDTNGNSIFAQEIFTANVGTIKYVNFYASTSAGTIYSNLKDSINLPNSTDTVQALGLNANTVYYLAVIAVDSQVADTVLDTVTTKNIDIDLATVYANQDSIKARLDTLLAAFLRSGYNVNNLIAAAVYGYITSPANDRLLRFSDSTAIQRWNWDYDISGYGDAADSNKAGYVQYRENNFDPVDDTIKKANVLVNGDKTGYTLTSAAYDSITDTVITEIEAHQSQTATSSGTAGDALGVNSVLNPKWGPDTLTVLGAGTAYANNNEVAGWYATCTFRGVSRPLVLVDSTETFEQPVSERRLNVRFAGATSAGVYDTVSFVTPLLTLQPGIYEYGARLKSISTNKPDTVQVRILSSSNAVLATLNVYTGTQTFPDSTFFEYAEQYIVSAETDVRYQLRMVDNHSGQAGASQVYCSYAFLNHLGYNLYAMDTASGVAPDVGMGRAIVDGAAAADASLWTQAQVDSLVARTTKIQDSLFALLDSIQDGANGMLVNVQAFNSDSSAANALGYILDTSSTGKGKMTVQNVAIGPAADGLTNPLAITAGAASVSAVQITQGTGSAAGLNISGGGPAVSLAGGATAASGLVVGGSGGAADVTGTFVDSAALSIGSITINLTGAGTNVLQKVYARDTSGTDEYVIDVVMTARALGQVTNAAGPLLSNDSGICNFTLPNGTFEILLRKGGYQFAVDTVVVTGDGSFTIDGYNTASVNQCAVWGYAGGINSDLYSNAIVTFTLANKVNDTCADVILTDWTTATRTDQNGRFEVNLIRSSCLSGEQYNAVIRRKDGSTRTHSFTVPDQTSYQLIWN